MRWYQLVAVSLFAGCVSETINLVPLGTCEPVGGTWAGVVFSDEEAHNALDFVDGAPFADLVEVRGIEPEVAREIVARRPFAGAADPLGELAQIPGITSKVLLSLRGDTYSTWCAGNDASSCCIELECAGAGGPIAHTRLDDGEAFSVLEWANYASQPELERVCGVGPATAAAITAARPLHGLRDLERVQGLSLSTWKQLLGDDLSECAVQGSVFSEWCSLSGTCVCQ